MLGKLDFVFLALAMALAQTNADAAIKGVMEKKLKMPGSDITATTLEIVLPPGDMGFPPHNHSGPFIGYVDEGDVLFQVEGHPIQLLPQGSSLYGEDHEVHLWCANPSKTKPTKIIFTILGRPGEPILTVLPDKKRESFEEALKKAVKPKKR